MDLIVEGKGLFIGKHQGRICVYRQQKALQETPLIHLKQIVVVDSGISISSDVIRVCSEEGIPIHFINKRGSTLAGLYATGLNGTILTRRAQLLAYTTPVGCRWQGICEGQDCQPEQPAAVLCQITQRRDAHTLP
jgi:CRISP-associated protein Cas1